MKKFQSLSDFQALPENQMKKTVGGNLWDLCQLIKSSVTGCGDNGADTSNPNYVWWESDWAVGGVGGGGYTLHFGGGVIEKS